MLGRIAMRPYQLKPEPRKQDGWMKPGSAQEHRRSVRLKGYDYSSPGAYFITIRTHNKRNLFGEIVDGQMHRNRYGDVVQEEWFRSAAIRKSNWMRGS